MFCCATFQESAPRCIQAKRLLLGRYWSRFGFHPEHGLDLSPAFYTPFSKETQSLNADSPIDPSVNGAGKLRNLATTLKHAIFKRHDLTFSNLIVRSDSQLTNAEHPSNLRQEGGAMLLNDMQSLK